MFSEEVSNTNTKMPRSLLLHFYRSLKKLHEGKAFSHVYLSIQGWGCCMWPSPMMDLTSLYKAPPASDIWWPRLETCSNLFTWKHPPPPALLLTSGGYCSSLGTVSNRVVCILLECLLVHLKVYTFQWSFSVSCLQKYLAQIATSSYPGWIKSPHVVTCHTQFPIGIRFWNWKVLKCQDIPKFQFGGGGGYSVTENWKVLKSQDIPKFQFRGGGGIL